MKRFLITGVSSGVGRVLTKFLVLNGNEVWGIARRKEFLQNLNQELKGRGKFHYSVADISQKNDWKNLLSEMLSKNFYPQIIIFNAAIFKPDFEKDWRLQLTNESFAINFFGVLQGVELLLKFVKKGTQFLAISSISSLKGSSIEGIGYPASKAALNIAFESLYQKYRKIFNFKILFFGPILGGMSPFKNKFLFSLTEDQAVQGIIKAVESKKIITYNPWTLFFILRVIKLLPQEIYFFTLSKIEKLHLKLKN